MPDGPTLGLMLPTFPQATDALPSLAELADVAAGAEAAGADVLWCCDHLRWHRPSVESLTASAVALAATTSCRVGPGVLQLPLRSPAAVAKAATSLQSTSGGRFVLGLGVGSHRGEYEALGADFDRRGPTMDEAVAVLQRTGCADRYRLSPAVDVPLWFGGDGQAARRRVASSGSGWLPLFLDAAAYGPARARLDEALNRAGRPLDAVTRGAVVFVAVAGHQDESDARRWLGSLLDVDGSRLAGHVVHGSASTCAAALADYVAAGAEHLAVFVPDDHPLPAFRELADAFGALW